MINTYLAVYAIAIVLLIAIALSGKFFFFGLHFGLKKLMYKGNLGLVFYRSIGNNFVLPKMIDLRKTEMKDDKKIHPYTRQQFKEGLFFGCPYIISDVEDIKTTYGLYKHQCDPTTGEALYWKTPEGENIAPVLDAIKTSVTVSPSLLKTAYSAAALGEAIRDFLKKNQTLLIVAGVAALMAGIAAYFAYSNNGALYNVCTVGLNDLKGRLILMAANTTAVA